MSRNPCRNCDFAFKRNGRHYQSYKHECYRCEKRKQHEQYLASKRTYEHGEVITDLAELLEQTYVYHCNSDRPTHVEAIKSWQLRAVLNALEKGRIHKAIKRFD